MNFFQVATACLTVALIATGGSALHYRHLASNHKANLDDAMSRLTQEQSRTAANTDRPAIQQPPAEKVTQKEEIKQTNLGRHEDMISQREAMRNRIQNSFADRAAILLNHTPQYLTEAETAERELMFHILENSWALSVKLNEANLSHEERGKILQILRDNGEVLSPLLKEERTRQLHDLGLTSGYSEEEAEQFVEYITETIDATSMRFNGGRGR